MKQSIKKIKFNIANYPILFFTCLFILIICGVMCRSFVMLLVSRSAHNRPIKYEEPYKATNKNEDIETNNVKTNNNGETTAESEVIHK